MDYRRLTPHVGPPVYLQQVAFSDVATAITAVPSFVFISRASPVDATFNNYSIYVQDTWAATPRFTLTYGLRWDYNPTPTFLGEGGLHPIVVNDVSNIATITAAPYGSPFYRATRNNFAPRIGLAYQFDTTPGRETVLRAGTGIFYDLGTGTIGNSTIGAPFQAFNIPAAATFPLPPADAAPPPLTTTPPFEAIVVGFPTRLRLPYSYHWNVSIQQSLGRDQSLTVGYVGSAGHSLLRISDYQGSALSSDIFYTDNSGYSHYNALQTQYRRRTAKGLDLLASYTYGHALDNGSSEVAFNGIPGKFIDPRNNYSRADFDIRHTATVGLSYDLPHPSGSRLAAALLGGWGIDPVFTLRTAPPVDVFVDRQVAFGFYQFRPDLVPGVPLYVGDSAAPGGRRINANAFSVPPEGQQGTLSRNALQAFSVAQFDLALRRRFTLTERIGLDARLEAFNVFNHPNFSPPLGKLGTVDSNGNLVLQNGFGVSQSMLNRGLQSTQIANGFNPLYQIGGSRSLQLALKLEF